jgi:DNA-binding CsgD family transcriptional regulator
MHKACAAIGPEEEVAAALEEAAIQARSRGGYTAETALLTRAADLTPRTRDRSRRLLAAAHAAHLAGNSVQAQALLDAAQQGDLDDLDRAKAQMLDGIFRLALGEGWRAPALLLGAAQSLAPLDAKLSRRVLLGSFNALLSVLQCSEGTTGRELGETILGILKHASSELTVDTLLRAVASAFVSEYSEAAQVLRLALAAFASMSAEEITEWHFVGQFVTSELWDPDAYQFIVGRLVAAAREQGAILALQPALVALATKETREGKFSAARERYVELLDITEAYATAVGGDTSFWALLDVELVAWEGDDKGARAKIDQLIDAATAVHSGSCILLGHLASAILELGHGRYQEALTAAQALEAVHAPGWSCSALPLIVEAAMRTGDTQTANEAYEQVVARAQVVETPYALGLMWRCQALVSDDDRTKAAFVSAIECFEKCPWRTELACTHLVYGEWLRRKKQRTEARAQLRKAYEMFESMGARAYAERARVELEATGEHARTRQVDTTADLTVRELQIARLAADRRTSREIASQLFVSPHTVEYHLKKVFQKLGVRSRRDLAMALRSESGPTE